MCFFQVETTLLTWFCHWFLFWNGKTDQSLKMFIWRVSFDYLDIRNLKKWLISTSLNFRLRCTFWTGWLSRLGCTSWSSRSTAMGLRIWCCCAAIRIRLLWFVNYSINSALSFGNSIKCPKYRVAIAICLIGMACFILYYLVLT